MPEPTLPRWQDDLELDGKLGEFNDLAGDPPGLVDALRQDVTFVVAIARADMRPYLRTWFTERILDGAQTGWAFEKERTGPVGPSAAGVEWSWTGTHDDEGLSETERGAFNGITATGRDVTVKGFTLMSVEKDEFEEDRFRVRRYIDWAGLHAQLGLTLNWRAPVSSAVADAPEPSPVTQGPVPSP